MKLLKKIGLPKKFSEADSGYSVDADEDPNLIYETHLFETNLDFEAAIESLDAFLSKHYGESTKTRNEMSCAIVWKLSNQKITAQISNLDGYVGGYINSQSDWIFNKTE